MHFADLHLNDKLLAAVAAEGYTTPTAIQQKAIPEVLTGRDLVGLAQTGTGKTAAFALPILHRLMQHPAPTRRHVRVLVLAPTRELAAQIGQSFATYGRGADLRHTVIFGGVGQGKQSDALRHGIDILVATPGRLLDLQGQGLVDFKHVEVFVLDEADRMLDMGFIHDVKKVVALLPTKRQTLFFSATMPPDVQKLANSLLTNPARVEVHPVSSTAERIQQSVYFVDRARKRALLTQLLRDTQVRRALVFTRTKQGANKVAELLNRAKIGAEAIHGNKSQGARERALANFVSGTTRVLVATDIAARGIDVEDISHIINYELPNVPETYVHRIGRTARAGASGVAISFCDMEERPYLADIERLTRVPLERVELPGMESAEPPPPPPPAQPPRPPTPRSPREARHRARSAERQKHQVRQEKRHAAAHKPQAAGGHAPAHKPHSSGAHTPAAKPLSSGGHPPTHKQHPSGGHAPAHKPHSSGGPTASHRGQSAGGQQRSNKPNGGPPRNQGRPPSGHSPGHGRR